MSERSFDDAPAGEILSALADGQTDAGEASRACQMWRDGSDTQATWHAYHLIGEVLRSPDAPIVSDSADFLRGVRARLADEPVVLSPQAAESVRQVVGVMSLPELGRSDAPRPVKRRVLAGPFAVAASFAAIVGALTLNLGPSGEPDSVQLARYGVGWAEGQGASPGLGSALDAGRSFSAVRTQAVAWQPLESGVDQAMSVQRPQPSAPATFADAPSTSMQSF
jgi:sigma-E factor negative regulatory protein RseA